MPEWIRSRKTVTGMRAKSPRRMVKTIIQSRSETGSRRMVHLVRLTFEGRRNRSLLAVNTHFPNQKDRPLNASRAQRMVELFEQIREMNRHLRLGLRLPTTMRVMDSDHGRAQVVQTHYPNEVALQTLPRRGDEAKIEK